MFRVLCMFVPMTATATVTTKTKKKKMLVTVATTMMTAIKTDDK